MKISAEATVSTLYGKFIFQTFNIEKDGCWKSHITVRSLKFDPANKVNLRVQCSCVTSTALNANICDCDDQVKKFMGMMSDLDNAILIYVQDEGRGHGMLEKNNTMHYMNSGYNTANAFSHRGLDPDLRDYEYLTEIFKILKINKSELIVYTNNLSKFSKIQKLCERSSRESLIVEIRPEIEKYLNDKSKYLEHDIRI